MTRPPFTLPAWVKVGLVYLTALALGGAGGILSARLAPASTALGRVGRALAGQGLATAEDVAAARAPLEETARQVFDLAVALRGLENRGVPDWEQARLLCERLDWERCDRGTLEAMARQVKE